MTDGWNFGDILDLTAAALPQDRPSLIHEDRTISWREFDRRTNNLARALLARGLKSGDRVAFYHRNGVEYAELLAAAFKARLTHVNVNYRYRDEELIHILTDSNATAVSFDAEFAPMIERLRSRAPGVKVWLQAGDATIAFGENYEALANEGDGSPLDIKRAPDDTLLLYTGGTTGMPKGVIWTHDTLRRAQLMALSAIGPAPMSYDAHREHIAAGGEILPFMPACPWMHGTGLSTALAQMCFAQPIVTVASSSGLDAPAIWRAISRHRVAQVAIVGDAFAKPMLAALEEDRDLDLTGLRVMISSGAMWSRDVKERFFEYLPHLLIADMFGASETLSFGASFSTRDAVAETARVMLTTNAKILREDGAPAGPGETGLIAIKGMIGAGYHGDAEKTKRTYREIDGETWCIPGDWARVNEDGSATLLGRGSNCINTAGEKVFPEEVEEVLKLAEGVIDALVVGVPDEKWGNAVVAIVTSDDPAPEAESNLRDFVASRLARYKAPKRIVFTKTVLRGPNGKADYKAARALAATGAAA